jgi:dihydropteroate synthase
MRQPYTVPLPDGRALSLGPRTLVMGVLNVTPDSFSDGGDHLDPGSAVVAGLRMAEEGADLIDIGGESTRPGSAPVPVEVERSRVLPVVQALAQRVKVPLSIDTTRAGVAEAALDAGAVIVNDISGLRADPALAPLVAARRAAVVLMHMRGRPADMAAHATYRDVVEEVARELAACLAAALRAGIPREAVVLDPGIGFAKRAGHSTMLLACLDAPALRALDRPWLVGPSRKSFLEAALGEVVPAARDWGTAAAVAAAVFAGAHVVRVHRVAEMVQVARVADMIVAARDPSGATAAPA